jgi:hypothetical protein
LALVTAEEIYKAAKTARPGGVLVYHVGVCLGESPDNFSAATHAVRHLYNEGLVSLAQRRLADQGQRRFEYLAIWRRHRRKPSPAPVVRITARNGRHTQGKYVNETRFDVPSDVARAWLQAQADQEPK